MTRPPFLQELLSSFDEIHYGTVFLAIGFTLGTLYGIKLVKGLMQFIMKLKNGRKGKDVNGQRKN